MLSENISLKKNNHNILSFINCKKKKIISYITLQNNYNMNKSFIGILNSYAACMILTFQICRQLIDMM